MTHRFVLVALLLVVTVACTGKSHSSAIDELRIKAGLDPCPASEQAGPSTGLPALTLNCLGNGPKVHMAGLRGVPTLVNVWGSWCGPCQREVPALQSLYVDASGRLRVLGVDSIDDHPSALDFAAHVHMKYPSVVDDEGTFIHRLGRNATPMTLFVDATGNVVHTKYGQFHNSAELRSLVKQYLGITA